MALGCGDSAEKNKKNKKKKQFRLANDTTRSALVVSEELEHFLLCLAALLVSSLLFQSTITLSEFLELKTIK